MFRFARISFAFLIAFLFSSAHAEVPKPVPASEQRTIIVFAASSLKNALDEASAQFQKTKGAEAKISYGASLTLSRQIEAGAPADLFISADVASMDYLAAKSLIKPQSRVDLLGNRLVVVAPQSSPLKTLALTKEAFESALGSDRITTGDPASVPVGKYARAALEKLGLWSALEQRFAFTDNVRSALIFVAREEAPLGIVYATDASSEPKVKILAAFPENSHPKIVYPFALTAPGGNEAAASFLEFMKGPAAKAVFERYGFIVLAK